jgi:putative (di)nucleoside polyphosphate hydrolase
MAPGRRRGLLVLARVIGVEPVGSVPRLRPAVGALVLNAQRKLLIGRRSDDPEPHWQFPQGGMKAGEDPADALRRELREELGSGRFRILDVLPHRTRYLWSAGRRRKHYDGQSHVWFVVMLDGEPEEEHRSEEFSDFAWIEPTELLARTHPIRRRTYEQVSSMLNAWLDAHPEPTTSAS